MTQCQDDGILGSMFTTRKAYKAKIRVREGKLNLIMPECLECEDGDAVVEATLKDTRARDTIAQVACVTHFLKTAIVSTDSGVGYSAEVPNMPGCIANGETLDELHRNLTLAIGSWFKEGQKELEEKLERARAKCGNA